MSSLLTLFSTPWLLSLTITGTNDSSKVGDTLTATVTGAAAASYKWTINGKGAVTTETYTVPADANAGDAIKLVVTAEDGETAEDTVYVGGFTILSVEPTTAQGERGYKYVRAYFSTGLKSLTPEDLVIRAVKSQQLYSVEAVKLSSDGTYADITIAGDASVAGTSFLLAGVKYGCLVNYDGDEAYLEFELPMFYSDLTVTGVDLEKAKVTVRGSGRVKTSDNTNDGWNYYGEYEIGDVYEGNLGTLVGRHVNMNVNSDDQVTDFYVQDEAIVIGAMETKNDDENGALDKRYFKDQLTGKTYYYSTNSTASNNSTQMFSAVTGGWRNWNTGDKYNYVKLVLNPNGTVASAVIEPTLANVIICTTNNKGKVTQDSDRAADFTGYTIVKDDEYIAPEDIEAGDVLYYNTADKFADVFQTTVTGEIGEVYATKVQLDETDYTWKGTHKTAQYYDEADDKYKEVDQPYLIKLDTEEETTFILDRRGEVKFVLGEETGITAYTNTDYVITDKTQAYWDKGYWYLEIPVSDGTATKLEVKLSDLKSWNGKNGKWTVTDNDKTAAATVQFTDEEITAASDESFAPIVISDGATGWVETVFDAAQATFDSILTVTTETETGKITGLKVEAAPKTTVKATGVTPDTTFQTGDTVLVDNDGIAGAEEKYNLSSSTPVYIIGKPDGVTTYPVKKVEMGSFNGATKDLMIGNVKFFTDKTNVTKVVIDNSVEQTLEQAKEAYTKNGIVLSYKTGFNTTDQKTTELKNIKVLTPDGEYTYTDFDDQIKTVAGVTLAEADKDKNENILDAFVTVGFNADDEVMFVKAIPGGEIANFAAITDSESATALTIGGVDVQAADDAVVAVQTGQGKYSATSIGEINTNNKYAAAQKTVKYHKTAYDAGAVKADLIVVKYVDALTVSTATIDTTSPRSISTAGGTTDLEATAVTGVAFTYAEVTDTDDVFTLTGTVVKLDPTVTPGTYTATYRITATGDGISAKGTATKDITVNATITKTIARGDVTLSREAGATDLTVRLTSDDSVTLVRNTDYTLSKTNLYMDGLNPDYIGQSEYTITPKGGYAGPAITVYLDEVNGAGLAKTDADFKIAKVEKAANVITLSALGATTLADTGTINLTAGTAAFAVTDAENTAGYTLDITAAATDGTLTYVWSDDATGTTAHGDVAANLVTTTGTETHTATCVVSCATTATHKAAADVTVVFTLTVTKS